MLKKLIAAIGILALYQEVAFAGSALLLGVGLLSSGVVLTTPTILPQPSALFTQSNPSAGNVGLRTGGGSAGAFSLPTSSTQFPAMDPQSSFAIYGEILMNPGFNNIASGLMASPGNNQSYGIMIAAAAAPILGLQFPLTVAGVTEGYWWLPTGANNFLTSGFNLAPGTNMNRGIFPWQATTACSSANGYGAREPQGFYGIQSSPTVGGGVADPGFLCGADGSGNGAAVPMSTVPRLGMTQAASITACLSNTPNSGQFQITVSVPTDAGHEAGDSGFSLAGFTTSGFNTNYMTTVGTTPTNLVGISATTGTCPGTTPASGGTIGPGTGGVISFAPPFAGNPFTQNATTGIQFSPNQRACFMIGENGDDTNFPGSQFAYATDVRGNPLPGSSTPVLSPWLNMGSTSAEGYIAMGPQAAASTFTFSAVVATNALAGATVSTLTYTNGAAPGFPSQTGYITFTLAGGTVPAGMALGDQFTVSGIVNSPTTPNGFNGTFKMGSGSSGTTLVGVAVSGNITSPGTFSSGASAVVTTGNTLSVTTTPTNSAFLYAPNTNVIFSGVGIPAGVTTITAQTAGTPGVTGTYTLSNYVGIPASETVTGTLQAGAPAITITSMDSFNITGATVATGQLYDVQFTIQAGNPFVLGSEFTVSGVSPSGYNGTYVAVAPTSSITPGTTIYGKRLNQAVGVPAAFTNPGSFTTAGSAVGVIMPGMSIAAPGGVILVMPYGSYGSTGTGGPGTYGTAGPNSLKSITGTISSTTLNNSTALSVGAAITYGDLVVAVTTAPAPYTGMVNGFGTGTGGTGTYNVTPGATVSSGIFLGPQGNFQTATSVSIYFASQFYSSLTTNVAGPPWGKITQRTSAATGDLVNAIGVRNGNIIFANGNGWAGAIANIGEYQGAFPNTLGVPSTSSFNQLCNKSTDFLTFASTNGGKWNSLYRLNDAGMWADSGVAQFNGSITAADGLVAGHATLNLITSQNGAATVAAMPTNSVIAGNGIAGCPSACPTLTTPSSGQLTFAAGITSANIASEAMTAGSFKPALPITTIPLTGSIASGVLTVTSVAPTTNPWSGTPITSTSTASGVSTSTVSYANGSGAGFTQGQCLVDSAGVISPTAPLCVTTLAPPQTSGSIVAVPNFLPNSFTFPGCTAPPAVTGCTDTIYAINSHIIPGQWIMGAGITTPAMVTGQISTVACSSGPPIPAGTKGLCGTYALSTSANGTVPASGAEAMFMSGIGAGGAIAPGSALTIDNSGMGVVYPIIKGTNPLVGNMQISGTYDTTALGGTPSNIQAMVSSYPGGPFLAGCSACNWTTLSSLTISGGKWSGTITNIPAGSPYWIYVRAGNGPNYATLPNWVGVGPVFATFGQGNVGWLTNNNANQETIPGLNQMVGFAPGNVTNGAGITYGPPIVNNLAPTEPGQYAVDAYSGAMLGDGTATIMQNASAVLSSAGVTVPTSISNMGRNGVGFSFSWFDNQPQTQTLGIGDGSSTIFSSGAGFGGTVGGNGTSNATSTQTILVSSLTNSAGSPPGLMTVTGNPSNSWYALAPGDAISCTSCMGGSSYSATIIAGYPTVPNGSSTQLTGTGTIGTYIVAPAPVSPATISANSTFTFKQNVLGYNTALAYGAGITATYSVVSGVPTLTINSITTGVQAVDPTEVVSDGTNSSTLLACTSNCTQANPTGSTWKLSDTNLSLGPCSTAPPCAAAVQPSGGAPMAGSPLQLGNVVQSLQANVGNGGGSIVKFGTFKALVNGTVVCQDNTSTFAWGIASAPCTDVGNNVDSANSWVNYQWGTWSIKFLSPVANGAAITAQWTNCNTMNNDQAWENICWVGNGNKFNGVYSTIASFTGGINGWLNGQQTIIAGVPLLIQEAKSYNDTFAKNFARFHNGQANTPQLMAGQSRYTGIPGFYGAFWMNAEDSELYFDEAPRLSQFSGTVSSPVSIACGGSTCYTAIMTLSGTATGEMWERELIDCNPASVACGSVGLAKGAGLPTTSEIVGICTTNLCGAASPSGWGTSGSTYLIANPSTAFQTVSSPIGMGNALYYPGAVYVGPAYLTIPQQTGVGGYAYEYGPGMFSGGRVGQAQGVAVASALAGNPSLGSPPTLTRALFSGCSVSATTSPCFDDGNTYAATASSATWSNVSGVGNVIIPSGISAGQRPFVAGQLLTCSPSCGSNLIITAVSLPPTQSTATGAGQVGQSLTLTLSGAVSGSGSGSVMAGCSGTAGVGSNCINIGFNINTGGTYSGQSVQLNTCGVNTIVGTNVNSNTTVPFQPNGAQYLTPNGSCIPTGNGAFVVGFNIGTAAISDSVLSANPNGIFSNVGSSWFSGYDNGYANGVYIQNQAYTCNIVGTAAGSPPKGIVQCVLGPHYNVPGQNTANYGLSSMNGTVSGIGVWPINTTYVSYGDPISTGGSGILNGLPGGQPYPFTPGSGYTVPTTTSGTSSSGFTTVGALCPFYGGDSGIQPLTMGIAINGGAITDVFPANMGSASYTSCTIPTGYQIWGTISGRTTTAPFTATLSLSTGAVTTGSIPIGTNVAISVTGGAGVGSLTIGSALVSGTTLPVIITGCPTTCGTTGTYHGTNSNGSAGGTSWTTALTNGASTPPALTGPIAPGEMISGTGLPAGSYVTLAHASTWPGYSGSYTVICPSQCTNGSAEAISVGLQSGTGGSIAVAPINPLEGLPGIATVDSANNQSGLMVCDNSGAVPGNPLWGYFNVGFTNGTTSTQTSPGMCAKPWGMHGGVIVTGDNSSVTSLPFTLPGSDTLKFIDPVGGLDTNNGLTITTAWKTPNHPMNCGDVAIVKPGTWTTGWGTWGTVSNCPSTTGGIDGAGGINAAIVVCASTLGSCNLNTSGGNAFDVNKNNWAVEGFNASTGAPSTGQAFFADACTSSGVLHHVIFANDVATNSGYGFDTNDCAGTNGEDYIAYVGGIAANANSYNGGASTCGSAIDMNAPKNLDTNAGTHMLVKGMFAFNNNGPPLITVNAGSFVTGGSIGYHILTVGTTNFVAIGAPSNTVGAYFKPTGVGSGTGTATTTGCQSDQEPFMWDVWNNFPYTGKGYASDNIAWHNGGYGFQIFGGGSSPLVRILDHLTMFDSCSQLPEGGPNTFFNCSEVNISIGNVSESFSLTNSILDSNKALAIPVSDGTPAYAGNYDSITTTTPGTVTATGNILWSLATNCEGVCSPSTGQPIFISCCTNIEFPPPSATYMDPVFTNTGDLLTNWLTSPTCSGFTDVASCMGWNNSTQSAVALTPISDLTPTATGTGGLGYRPPGPCAVDANYPLWMKGINYIQVVGGFVNGATLTENAGLTNKPCGI